MKRFHNTFLFLFCLVASTAFSSALRIVNLTVPALVEKGTRNSVYLDCQYEIKEDEKEGLVVRWYFNNQHFPVYQWIPNQKPQDLGVMRKRLNLTYKVSDDPYQMYRAMQILNPSTEFSGNYSCCVSTFDSEDLQTKTLPNIFNFLKTNQNKSVNLTCNATGIFPEPKMTLCYDQALPKRRECFTTQQTISKKNGLYEISCSYTFGNYSLYTETTFECVLTIPLLNYSSVKRSKYKIDDSSDAAEISSQFLYFIFIGYIMK